MAGEIFVYCFFFRTIEIKLRIKEIFWYNSGLYFVPVVEGSNFNVLDGVVAQCHAPKDKLVSWSSIVHSFYLIIIITVRVCIEYMNEK